MDIAKLTNEYYSKLCCCNIDSISNGVHFIESDNRNEVMLGFDRKFTIYVYSSTDKIIIAYSPKYHDEFEEIKKTTKFTNIIDLLFVRFPKLVTRKLFMYVGNKDIDTTGSFKMKEQHYPYYEKFFLTLHPNINISDGWLKEYYNDKAKKGYMFGYFENDLLVSFSDAPDMPYMNDVIQHTGIATLKEYRYKGYAKRTSYFAAQELIKSGVCPQWETDKSNIASINLAKSIGYVEVADAHILEE